MTSRSVTPSQVRCALLLRDEIAQTLAEGADVDEEMRALFGAFSG